MFIFQILKIFKPDFAVTLYLDDAHGVHHELHIRNSEEWLNYH